MFFAVSKQKVWVQCPSSSHELLQYAWGYIEGEFCLPSTVWMESSLELLVI